MWAFWRNFRLKIQNIIIEAIWLKLLAVYTCKRLILLNLLITPAFPSKSFRWTPLSIRAPTFCCITPLTYHNNNTKSNNNYCISIATGKLMDYTKSYIYYNECELTVSSGRCCLSLPHWLFDLNLQPVDLSLWVLLPCMWWDSVIMIIENSVDLTS